MEWEYILTQVFWIFLKTLIILGIYLFTKFYVSDEPITKRTKKGLLFRKIKVVTMIIIISFILCGLTTSNDNNYNRFIIYFLVIIIPALLGAWNAFGLEIKMKVKKEEIDAENNKDGL